MAEFSAFLKLGCVQRLLGVLDRGLAWVFVEYRQGVFTTPCRSMIRPNGVGTRLSALFWQQAKWANLDTLGLIYVCGMGDLAT